MRLLVLAALAAVALADVSHLAGHNVPALQYGVPPASSYSVPQSSVTERPFNLVPTSPSPNLHLPAFEYQDFKSVNSFPGPSISSTAAPFVDTGFVSSTPAPSVDSGLVVSSTPAPSVLGGAEFSFPGFSTPAPSITFNSGDLGGFSQLGGFVSSTPAPSVDVTSGSQEKLSFDAQLPSFGFNGFTTAAPSLFTPTVAPTVSTVAPGLGYSFPGFGLGGYSTPAPIAFGSGGLASINPSLYGSDAALNSVNVHGVTSGGSLSDAFGISSGPVAVPGVLPQPQQVSRHLYFYAAPEEPEPPRPRINIAPVAPPKKNVKVIFIKTPSPPPPAPIHIAAPPQDEEKTIVYVLVKKPEEHQNIEIQTPPPTPPPKPEVYFIKYKTPQEAEQAIAQVQSSSSEGVAPSLPANTVSESEVLSSIKGPVTALPVFNSGFLTSTTPTPLFNFVGNGGFVDYAPDISQNLIPSGVQSSSLFSTSSPFLPGLSTADNSLIGSSTVAPLLPQVSFESTTTSPILPHVTYGPPVFKKK